MAAAAMEEHREGPVDGTSDEGRLAEIGSCLAFLTHSVALGSPALFADYVAWAKIVGENVEPPPKPSRGA